MPNRTDWSRVQRSTRVREYDRTHPSVRVRHPRQLPHIPLWARLLGDGRTDQALDAAVAAYYRARRTHGTVVSR